MNVHSLEGRIVELESRQAFQDHTIEELNEVIISQQEQIDFLASRVVRLETKIVEAGGDEFSGLETHGS